MIKPFLLFFLLSSAVVASEWRVAEMQGSRSARAFYGELATSYRLDLGEHRDRAAVFTQIARDLNAELRLSPYRPLGPELERDSWTTEQASLIREIPFGDWDLALKHNVQHRTAHEDEEIVYFYDVFVVSTEFSVGRANFSRQIKAHGDAGLLQQSDQFWRAELSGNQLVVQLYERSRVKKSGPEFIFVPMVKKHLQESFELWKEIHKEWLTQRFQEKI